MNDGARTRDILDHNQVLYQLSYIHQGRGARRRTAGLSNDECSGCQVGPAPVPAPVPDPVRAPPCSLASTLASSDVGPGRGTKIAAR